MKHKTPLIVVGFVCGALAIPALGSQTSTTQFGTTATTQQPQLLQVAYRHYDRGYRHHYRGGRTCVPVRYKRCYWHNSYRYGRSYRCYYNTNWRCYYRYRGW